MVHQASRCVLTQHVAGMLRRSTSGNPNEEVVLGHAVCVIYLEETNSIADLGCSSATVCFNAPAAQS